MPLGIAALAFAAAADVGFRRIPDRWPILLALAGLALRAPLGASALGQTLAAALILAALLVAAFAAGAIGGGDVKLATAAAIALPPSLVPLLVVATMLAGGVLALLYLALAAMLPPPGPRPSAYLARLTRVEIRRIRACHPLPYGVAIAAGAAFTQLSSLQA